MTPLAARKRARREEFVEGFAGGRHHFEARTKELGWVEFGAVLFQKGIQKVSTQRKNTAIMVMMYNVH